MNVQRPFFLNGIIMPFKLNALHNIAAAGNS